LRSLDGFRDLAEKLFEILVAIHEVDLRGVNDQKIGEV